MRCLCLLLVLWAVPGFSIAQDSQSQDSIAYESAQLQLIDDVTIASLDPGVVQRVGFKPGQAVKKGDVIVELDQDLYAVEVQIAEQELEMAKQQLKNDVNIRYAAKTVALSEKTLGKSESAVEEVEKSISETEIDRLKLELEQARLSKEQAENEREIAKLNVGLRGHQRSAAEIRLRRRRIVSPVDGMVVDVPVQVGESVANGQAIARVISLEKLRVFGVFSADYIFQVNNGSAAYFEIERDGESVQVPVKITFVSPEIRITEQSFDVWAEIDNSDGKFLPGMKGVLQIKLPSQPGPTPKSED